MEISYRNDPSYRAGTIPRALTIPNMTFLTFAGSGSPEELGKTTQFQQAIQALYGALYTIKFWEKKHHTPPGYTKFTTTPLEGLWWMDGQAGFDQSHPEKWQWKLMIRVPEFVTQPFLDEVIADLIVKKQSDFYRDIQLEHFEEGLAAQIMHIGPYDQENADIQKLHAFISEQGHEPIGKHHELYFSDPRRTKPERLRTILRQPMRKKKEQ